MLQELETQIITKPIVEEEEEAIIIQNDRAYRDMIINTVSKFTPDQLQDLKEYIYLEDVADGSHIVDGRGVAMPDQNLWQRFDQHRLEMIGRYNDGDEKEFVKWLDNIPVSNTDIRREILNQASEKK